MQGKTNQMERPAWLVGIVALVGVTVLIGWGTSRWLVPPPPTSAVSAFVTDDAQLSPETLATRWIVSAAEAEQLITQGATVLDVRPAIMQRRGTVVGSVAVTWRQFSEPDFPHQGQLLADPAKLTEQLQWAGVERDRPVVVIGAPPQDWGKAGRIVWMLRNLGHEAAVLVDGGYRALATTDIAVTTELRHQATQPGDFTIQDGRAWEVQHDELQAWVSEMQAGRLVASPVIILDTRELREFKGETPYGEQRGGHVPGAIHLHYQDLMDGDGKLLPRAEIRQMLAEMGISEEAIVVAYCTGGIRSAWVTAVLADLGWAARNYAGSMWEWAAFSEETHPLVRR
jgi:thiosulfate/3-mercaptopyruvate sulfurtransferase